MLTRKQLHNANILLLLLASYQNLSNVEAFSTNEVNSFQHLSFGTKSAHPKILSNSLYQNQFYQQNKIILQQQFIRKSSKQSGTRRYDSNRFFPDWLNNNNDSDKKINGSYGSMEPKVYPQRWIQLGYLSLLALLSDWICFAVAAAPSTFENAYPGHSAAALIDIFLFTNVASCFLVTDVVANVGLGKAIKGASVLMTLGCLLRSGTSFFTPILNALHLDPTILTNALPDSITTGGLVSYPFIVAGTVLVGAAQPFFQCTPPMLSATWFASDERATSTAVALNFNQIGIATAFLVGGSMAAESATGLASYFTLITGVCIAVTAGTLLQFQEKPPSPPSVSEIEKLIKGEKEPPFIESVASFFKTGGFTFPLAAFICSISITNLVGTFIDEVLERGGITEQLSIDLVGAGFELSILVGGIVIGGYVDRTKKYKDVTLLCLLLTVFLIVPLGLTDHALGKEPLLLILSLLGLGMAAGPIQPINAELAVDVVYPGDETAVESVQQIGGNLISALLVPVAEIAAQQDYQLLPTIPWLASDIRGDVILLMSVAIITFTYFSGFDAPLKRSLADSGDESFAENGSDGTAAIKFMRTDFWEKKQNAKDVELVGTKKKD